MIRGAGVVVLGTVGAMLGVVGAYVMGVFPDSLAGQAGWIRVNPIDPAEGWRLQFPFAHHNRAGYFGMCAAFLIPVFLLGATRVSVKIALASGLAGGLVCLSSSTRGAVLGLVFGALSALCCFPSHKRRQALVISLIGIILASVVIISLHLTLRARWSELLTLNTRPTNTVSSRLVIQSVALEFISQRPFLGWGYGYLTFEQLSKKSFPEIAAAVEGMSHPHNQWIEQLFEGGVLGLFLFLGFTLFRLMALASCLRNERRSPTDYRWLLILSLWFGLEMAVQVYGLTNSALRRNLGLWSYVLWTGSLLLVMESHQRWQRATLSRRLA